MVMVRITGPEGLLTLSLHWSQGLLWIVRVILCFSPSSSARLFPDDFIEKQWQILAWLLC